MSRKYFDPLWHVQVAIVVAIVLQILLPARLTPGPRFFMPGIEGLLLVCLSLTTPKRYSKKSETRRAIAIVMIAITVLANVSSLGLLVQYLTNGGKANGKELIIAAVNIFLTNIIVFGLLYWEMDSGGPSVRHNNDAVLPDFMFPQANVKELAPADWLPTFIDYLYVSATNATAFSPTDTLPLTHRAKILMLFQALVSLITVALVTARAVNILN
jgi:uncharacterized membrane protein